MKIFTFLFTLCLTLCLISSSSADDRHLQNYKVMSILTDYFRGYFEREFPIDEHICLNLSQYCRVNGGVSHTAVLYSSLGLGSLTNDPRWRRHIKACQDANTVTIYCWASFRFVN